MIDVHWLPIVQQRVHVQARPHHIQVLDPASLGAAEGGGSTGEFICIAALGIVDSMVAVAVSPTSEPSCIS